jgi:hypothetical protein
MADRAQWALARPSLCKKLVLQPRMTHIWHLLAANGITEAQLGAPRTQYNADDGAALATTSFKGHSEWVPGTALSYAW